MSIEAMKQALEALELALRSHGVMLLSDPPQDAWKTYGVEVNARQAITALRTAIEQAEKRWSEFNETTKRNIEHADWYLSTHSAPEPVGVVKVLPLGDGHKPMHWADWTDDDNHPPEGTLLYTTPPAAQRQWVGLTDEEIIQCTPTWGGTVEDVARAIEAKLREKNT